MTAQQLFKILKPLVAPGLEMGFDRRDLCILSTRIVIETARCFGIDVKPVPVRVVLYNRAFAAHVANRFEGVERGNPASWGDGSWSVGIGCGAAKRPGFWDGHLIAMADGWFGDFSIRQAERLEHGIVTGPALIGPHRTGTRWQAVNDKTGTVIEYEQIDDNRWRNSPDWRDPKRRRSIVGALVLAVRAVEAECPA